MDEAVPARWRPAASEMQQVLLNLINNAIDAMDPRAAVELDIMSTACEDNQVHPHLHGSDTGPAAFPRRTCNVFSIPFFTTKPVGKGTGLGLSIIYGIINKMDGEISAWQAPW